MKKRTSVCTFLVHKNQLPFSFFVLDIDHFHKWRPIINSFCNYYIKISLSNLILKLIIQKSFYSETRLARLI